MVEESQADVDAREERDAKARKIREDAIAYAERVAAGEEPWKDEEADVNDSKEESTVAESESVVEADPLNDDVSEEGAPGDEVVEVDQENPAPEPTE